MPAAVLVALGAREAASAKVPGCPIPIRSTATYRSRTSRPRKRRSARGASAPWPRSTSATAPGRPLPRWTGSFRPPSAGSSTSEPVPGALTRLLIDKADEVVAVEPDDRMRSVLAGEVPGIRAVNGRGESIPIPDGSADAVLASSSWHWMDPIPTLLEVGRVLVPGGILGALWSGPDPEGAFIMQARALLAEESHGPADAAVVEREGDPAVGEFAGLIMGDADRPASRPGDPTRSALRPARTRGVQVGCGAQR